MPDSASLDCACRPSEEGSLQGFCKLSSGPPACSASKLPAQLCSYRSQSALPQDLQAPHVAGIRWRASPPPPPGAPRAAAQQDRGGPQGARSQLAAPSVRSDVRATVRATSLVCAAAAHAAQVSRLRPGASVMREPPAQLMAAAPLQFAHGTSLPRGCAPSTIPRGPAAPARARAQELGQARWHARVGQLRPLTRRAIAKVCSQPLANVQAAPINAAPTVQLPVVPAARAPLRARYCVRRWAPLPRLALS